MIKSVLQHLVSKDIFFRVQAGLSRTITFLQDWVSYGWKENVHKEAVWKLAKKLRGPVLLKECGHHQLCNLNTKDTTQKIRGYEKPWPKSQDQANIWPISRSVNELK